MLSFQNWLWINILCCKQAKQFWCNFVTLELKLCASCSDGYLPSSLRSSKQPILMSQFVDLSLICASELTIARQLLMLFDKLLLQPKSWTRRDDRKPIKRWQVGDESKFYISETKLAITQYLSARCMWTNWISCGNLKDFSLPCRLDIVRWIKMSSLFTHCCL